MTKMLRDMTKMLRDMPKILREMTHTHRRMAGDYRSLAEKHDTLANLYVAVLDNLTIENATEGPTPQKNGKQLDISKLLEQPLCEQVRTVVQCAGPQGVTCQEIYPHIEGATENKSRRASVRSVLVRGANNTLGEWVRKEGRYIWKGST